MSPSPYNDLDPKFPFGTLGLSFPSAVTSQPSPVTAQVQAPTVFPLVFSSPNYYAPLPPGPLPPPLPAFPFCPMKPPGNSTQPQLLDIPSISHPAGNTALCKGLIYSSCLQRPQTLLDPSFMLPSCTLQAVTGLPSCKDKIPVPFKLLVFHQTTSLCYLCHLLISLLFPKTYTYINLLSPIPSLILGGLRAPQVISHPVPLVLRLDTSSLAVFTTTLSVHPNPVSFTH